MDYETIEADVFGAGLRGIGLNLLCSDVLAMAGFLEAVFNMGIHRRTADFAIVTYGGQSFQLHADGTYHSHPLLGLLPETPPRGAGVELRLYDSDPDLAAGRAETAGGHILQPPTDKPHGLREACIAGPDGYVWVPSRPL